MLWHIRSSRGFLFENKIAKSWSQEIDEMIETVDRNEDWKINYSEFRVRNLAL
jgi:Ca2+-binding EF-hand superfamily protein